MEKNRYRIVVLILIFYEIFCAVHIPAHDIAEHHHRDAQITKEAAEQIYSVQMQELSEIKKICNVRCYIRESIIFFEIAKFAYEITKVNVYIWQLPRRNIGGIMMKTN
jgi:type I restriction-modification system DNA methylase subunit